MNNVVFIAARTFRVKLFFSVLQANNTEVTPVCDLLISDQTDATASKDMGKEKKLTEPQITNSLNSFVILPTVNT